MSPDPRRTLGRQRSQRPLSGFFVRPRLMRLSTLVLVGHNPDD
jgi:hypothetical protein